MRMENKHIIFVEDKGLSPSPFLPPTYPVLSRYLSIRHCCPWRELVLLAFDWVMQQNGLFYHSQEPHRLVNGKSIIPQNQMPSPTVFGRNRQIHLTKDSFSWFCYFLLPFGCQCLTEVTFPTFSVICNMVLDFPSVLKKSACHPFRRALFLPVSQ